ncbi:putative acetyltransferase [Saccharothrix coeruleofusca]|uniref:GNAT family N-acetyltransferase n=1 Tax=Saccharothrix coeruleofusca TaxID=33919 RepID=UPI001AE683B6|nr:GNAT family N-acetyltransferase [Saccharothrix coeruleofusca]MBP2336965.1 putative acetyltransferase [Saccharothrix coeruleofusca]
MTDIRVLDDEADYRAAHALFRGTLHHPPAPDDRWKVALESYLPGRVLASFDGGEMVGTVQSFPSALALPGGEVVRMGAVSRVGVRADRTRRGVLSGLQSAQLRGLRELGDVAATLRASEAVIYGRFGYGAATRGRTLRLDRRRAAPRSRVRGDVRLVGLEEGERIIRTLFERVSPGRPGTIARWDAWWSMNVRHSGEEALRIVVRSGPGGDDGYVAYKVDPGSGGLLDERSSVLTVLDLWAVTPEAWADLWRFLVGVDLVSEISAPLRPLDEPVGWLLADPRACKVVAEDDETWLRLLDVPQALARRDYRAAEPVVLGVRDRYLPDNEGAYLVAPDGATRTDREPDLVLDVDVLAAAFLGDVPFRALAATGRLEVVDPAAVARADALFAVDQSPWSGTYF